MEFAKYKKILWTIACGLSMTAATANAQEYWDLQKCLDYAMEHNLEVQSSKVGLDKDRVNTKEARAQRQPSLSFSTSHSLSNNPWLEMEGQDKTAYNGRYSIDASWTVFDGFKRKYNIRKQELQERIDSVSIASVKEDVAANVIAYFIQTLYATENLRMKANALEVAEAEYDRSNSLFEAGSMSKSDFSQIKAQLTKEKYELIVAQNDLTKAKLDLTLLLRLETSEEIEVGFPEISDEQILRTLEDKSAAYEVALAVRPEIRSAKMNEEMAELGVKSAKAGYYPSIGLSASVGTSHSTGADPAWGDQMKQNFGESVGLSLKYSILDNRSRKSEKERAKLECYESAIQTELKEESLKKLIESVHNDATSAQSSYVASLSNEESAQTTYDLVKEKSDLGAATPFEMLSERNTLLNVQSQTIQAKYTAILNILLLKLYQGLPVEM